MKRLFILILVIASVAFIYTGCDRSPTVDGKSSIGVIYGFSGSADKSFNEAIKFAVSQILTDYRTPLFEVESRDATELTVALNDLVEKDLDCIVVACDPIYLEPIARENTNQRFILVSGAVEMPNVMALSLADRRASAAVGGIAGLTTQTGRIGFIGAVEDRTARRILAGFQEGAAIVYPDIEVIANFIGDSLPSEENTERARQLAQKQYDRGVDIIFAFCGNASEGVFATAADNNALAIGSDLNQNWIERGYVLTSMLRNVSDAVYSALSELIGGSFTPGIVAVEPGNGGLGYHIDKYNQEIIPIEAEETVRRIFRVLDERDAIRREDAVSLPEVPGE
jgi:basic membrane protein A